jgi:hypothetical protein
MMICSTLSATVRRKSPSPVFAINSARDNLSSVIGINSSVRVKLGHFHLSR